MSHFQLLSTANPKTQKGVARGYLTYVLHLAPADVSGYEVCPGRSPGCTAACLNLSGRGGMFTAEQGTNAIQEARKRKTRWFFLDRDSFMQALISDIERAVRQAARLGLTAVFRLNATSDLPWAAYRVDGKNIFELFPDVQFYDYTAVVNRFRDCPANYHLTFSAKENNAAQVSQAIALGANISVVFDAVRDQSLPSQYLGLPVINGDQDDLRFLDPVQSVVGLHIKGRLRTRAAARFIGFARVVS